MSPINRNTTHKLLFILFMLCFFSCKKAETTPVPSENTDTGTPEDTTITPAVDPVTANTMGFFLDNNWTAKSFTAPSYVETTVTTSTATTTVTADASSIITKIPSSAFGHNANTWMTTMVDQSIFMNHITNLKPNIIRFPAGSGSDAYFWNSKPGGKPADAPDLLMDKDGNKKDPGYGYGKTTDNWRASLDNYYSMLQQSNNQGILTMNYGYARYGTSANPVATAAHLAADWVRYDNGRTKYWEIGNENYADWEWGYRIDVSTNKDGQPQYLTGKLYAQHFKVFADSMRKAAAEVGTQIYIGAVTYESTPPSYAVSTTKNWNSTMIPELKDSADFYIGHNYITPYGENSTAATILGAALAEPGKMIDFMTSTISKYGGTIKPIAMTEWNMWASGSKQQVSNTSGAFAVIVVAEAIKNKFGLVARWDLLNGWNNGDDHGLFSAGDEPGVAKWSPRPSFYYMYFFQKYIGDRLIATSVKGNSNIKAYASTYTSGETNVTLLNASSTPQTVQLKIKNFRTGSRFYWYSLEGSNDNGEFSRKVLVNGSGPTGVAGGPADYSTLEAKSASISSDGIKVTVPALGAIIMVVEKK